MFVDEEPLRLAPWLRTLRRHRTAIAIATVAFGVLGGLASSRPAGWRASGAVPVSDPSRRAAYRELPGSVAAADPQRIIADAAEVGLKSVVPDFDSNVTISFSGTGEGAAILFDVSGSSERTSRSRALALYDAVSQRVNEDLLKRVGEAEAVRTKKLRRLRSTLADKARPNTANGSTRSASEQAATQTEAVRLDSEILALQDFQNSVIRATPPTPTIRVHSSGNVARGVTLWLFVGFPAVTLVFLLRDIASKRAVGSDSEEPAPNSDKRPSDQSPR